ncbi:phosphoglycerate dehydrogenase [Pseudoroseomonas deserti]|uniref:Phosphoglycerate dehydrogenase n=1 Tax=Teichococcus deserti TaxID=1817963 RepID=A0A1V2H3D3_9PROT|nr:C-terminal binding protein [Pseudoroseomonas deserti]ONG54945.1 phosphoglycerate dehydrogenase [Pseudoroseomonas deserti]
MLTVLEPEGLYPDTALEDALFAGRIRLLRGGGESGLAALPDALCAEAEGLFIFRNWLRAEDLPRFPKLRAVVRMGVGYDRLDRVALAERGVAVCNVPDYGTTEVADHAVALALALRRGIALHHDLQRGDSPAAWTQVETPLIQRLGEQNFGILGLGRIGTAVALRARAFGFDVAFYDPHLPNGVDRALGITRCRSLEALMERTDTLSLHAPLTRATTGLVDEAALRRLRPGAVVVNTARGPILDLDALERCLRDGHLAGAGLDVLPIEPPATGPIPPLLAAYRARESWLSGRLIVTPHSAFHTPAAYADIRLKSAETMHEILTSGVSANRIPLQAE